MSMKYKFTTVCVKRKSTRGSTKLRLGIWNKNWRKTPETNPQGLL